MQTQQRPDSIVEASEAQETGSAVQASAEEIKASQEVYPDIPLPSQEPPTVNRLTDMLENPIQVVDGT